jgi:tetratricopeptide (TPR) repeat protein
MSTSNRTTDNTLPLQEGESAILLNESLKLYRDNKMHEAEAKLRRIINGPYQCNPDVSQCGQALDLLCSLLRQHGEYEQIVICCRSLLKLFPDLINAHYFLGASYQMLGENVLGLQHYHRVLDLVPDHTAAHLNSGILLVRLQNYQQATFHYQKVIELQPGNIDAHINLGVMLHNLGKFAAAAISYKRVLEIDPLNAYVCFQLADICEMTNRIEEADHYLKQGESLSPEHPLSHRLAATLLRRQGRIDEAIARLTSAPIPEDNQQLAESVHFELGKLYERRQDSERAYEHYQQGNRLLLQRSEAAGFNKDNYLNMIRTIRQTFTSEWLSTWTPSFEVTDQTVSEPVFLVGFPRSGTTLLDQILASHPALQVIEEQPMIASIRREMGDTPAGYLDVLADLEPSRIEELRQLYLVNAAQYLEHGRAGAFVDKLPLNIVHLGNL